MCIRDRTGSARRGARRHHDADPGGEPADAGRTARRRGDLAVPGAHPDPGNDARLRAEDSRDLPGHADRAAVHGRQAAGRDAAHLGAHHRGVKVSEWRNSK